MDFNFQSINLVVGLGNSGEEYSQTRHNAGFMWIDALHTKLKYPEWKVNKSLKSEVSTITQQFPILIKPTTMMNSSGVAARLTQDFYKLWPQHTLVVFDDLDLPLGTYKLQFNKGPKIHNGLDSVRSKLGTEKFWHLRLGIDARELKGNKSIPGYVYSMQKFATLEQELLNTVINSSINEIIE